MECYKNVTKHPRYWLNLGQIIYYDIYVNILKKWEVNHDYTT